MNNAFLLVCSIVFYCALQGMETENNFVICQTCLIETQDHEHADRCKKLDEDWPDIFKPQDSLSIEHMQLVREEIQDIISYIEKPSFNPSFFQYYKNELPAEYQNLVEWNLYQCSGCAHYYCGINSNSFMQHVGGCARKNAHIINSASKYRSTDIWYFPEILKNKDCMKLIKEFYLAPNALIGTVLIQKTSTEYEELKQFIEQRVGQKH